MTPEQMLAGLQDEVGGLSETVQRLTSENETVWRQSTVGTVRTVKMANEVAKLNKPTAFSGAEEEHGDWEFALTCFVGTMDGTLLTELRAVGSKPKSEANLDGRSWEREGEDVLQYPGTADDEGTAKNGARGTRPNGYEAYRSLVLRFGSRDAHGETTLLIKVMNFNFGDIDAMETKFEEFNLLIKEHDDISSIDNRHDQTSHSCGKSARTTVNPFAIEQSVIHNLPRDASGNQSVPERAQRFQTHGAR